MAEQAKQASERIDEAEKLRSSAMQEAAYYRAKLAALEASSIPEASRLDRDRIAELERQLSASNERNAEQNRKFKELSESVALQTTLLEQAEARADDASKRAAFPQSRSPLFTFFSIDRLCGWWVALCNQSDIVGSIRGMCVIPVW